MRKLKARGYTAAYKKRRSPEKVQYQKSQQRLHKQRWWASLSPDERKVVIDTKRRRYQTSPTTRIKKQKDNKLRYVNLRKAVLEKLGGRCSSPNCAWINSDGSRGCVDFRCLQIDHEYGGGTKEFRSMTMHAFLKKVLENSDGYQALCANCNWIKRVNNREFSKGKPLSSNEPQFLAESSSLEPAVL